MFEKVTCVTLERRDDRWQKFVGSLPDDLPFGEIEKRIAIDGKKCPCPTWWKQGGGAWGCYQSHLQIIQECLNEGVKSLLLLEDDAVFCENFASKYKEFAEHLPEDWGMLYLGGQHFFQKTSPPTRVNEWVYRPYNVNRTHAWALRGRTMRDVYTHLCETRQWPNRHHIDHHLGTLCMKRKHPVYCPKEWLVGQSEGVSNIANRKFPERFWPAANIEESLDTPFVLVVGLHRSGSSLIAGMLHTIGVSMGNKFVGCEFNGGHEAETFARLCEQMMKYPSTGYKLSEENFTRRFRRWAVNRSKESQRRHQIPGCKYPHACALAPLIKNAVGDSLKVIHIDRPLEKSIDSLIRRDGSRKDHKQLESIQRFLWGKKTAFLATHEHHTVQYEELLENPEKELAGVISFLNLDPKPRKIEQACKLVDKSKQHIQ